MKNVNKLTSTYTYPAKNKGEPMVEVGFYLEPKLDRFGNVLRKFNVTDVYGQIHNIPYSGNSLMISVKTSSRTTLVRAAIRKDLERYKEAYNAYLSNLSEKDKKEHQEKLYLFLEELPPVEEKKAKESKKTEE